MGIFSEETRRRTLTGNERQMLWTRNGGKCQGCEKEITYLDMQVGHRTAYSKGGTITLKNALCLCYTCNKMQRTLTWAQFQKKLGKEDPTEKTKKGLRSLNLRELKFLAAKYRVRVSGTIQEGIFSDTRIAPDKGKYIRALTKVVNDADIELAKASTPKPVVKRKRKQSSSWW
jgi:hypothetical protein